MPRTSSRSGICFVRQSANRAPGAARGSVPTTASVSRFRTLARAAGTRSSQSAGNDPPARSGENARTVCWARVRQLPVVPQRKPDRVCYRRVEPRPATTVSRPPPACGPPLPSSVLFRREPMGGESASSSRVTAPELRPGAAPVGPALPDATVRAWRMCSSRASGSCSPCGPSLRLSRAHSCPGPVAPPPGSPSS